MNLHEFLAENEKAPEDLVLYKNLENATAINAFSLDSKKLLNFYAYLFHSLPKNNRIETVSDDDLFREAMRYFERYDISQDLGAISLSWLNTRSDLRAAIKSIRTLYDIKGVRMLCFFYTRSDESLFDTFFRDWGVTYDKSSLSSSVLYIFRLEDVFSGLLGEV